MNADLKRVTFTLKQARRPEDVFGHLSGSPTEQQAQAKKVYRRLARAVHPDRNDIAPEAYFAMDLVATFFDQVQAAIAAGTYGSTAVAPKVTMKTKRHEYAISDIFATGDIANLYRATTGSNRHVVLKVAREPVDNDLIKAEATVLNYLSKPDRPEGAGFIRYLPELIESFPFSSGSTVQQVNAFVTSEGLRSLDDVHRAYPKGIDARDMAWMFRRLLTVLGYIHARGVIHGAVLPVHVLIDPAMHHVVLIDWCYSVNLTLDPKAHISALSVPYERWYPREVTGRKTPSPATDILMAARCMIWLLGGDPLTGRMPDTVPMLVKGFLLSCVLPAPSQRPQDAWKLLDEFTTVIDRLWERKFRPFTMPTR